jgi:hypothetical protein
VALLGKGADPAVAMGKARGAARFEENSNEKVGYYAYNCPIPMVLLTILRQKWDNNLASN